jgi:hypothetical protein
MKALILVLTIYAAFLMAWPVNVYSEDSKSSGVIVIGPSVKSTAQSTSNGPEVPVADPLKFPQPGDNSKVKITGPELNASFRIIYKIEGSRIGATQVSDAVVLPADGMITVVNPGMGGAFTIVRVDEEGKETLALSMSPEHAIGQKLSKGKYKIYPLDPDGKFTNEKLTAKVEIGLMGNEVMDPRARGELYKTEKEK